VHHRLRHLVAPRVDPVQDLEAELGPDVRSGRAPRRDRCRGGGEHRVDVSVRVGQAEVDAVRRPLAGHLAVGAGLAQRERLAEVVVEGRLAVGGRLAAGGVLAAVRLEVLGVGRPVAALPDRGERALQGLAVVALRRRRHAP
jgi:hypothetical protein